MGRKYDDDGSRVWWRWWVGSIMKMMGREYDKNDGPRPYHSSPRPAPPLGVFRTKLGAGAMLSLLQESTSNVRYSVSTWLQWSIPEGTLLPDIYGSLNLTEVDVFWWGMKRLTQMFAGYFPRGNTVKQRLYFYEKKNKYEGSITIFPYIIPLHNIVYKFC